MTPHDPRLFLDRHFEVLIVDSASALSTLSRVIEVEVRTMTRRRVSNPLALAVLACLTERPMHPYEISTTLRTRGKEKSIKLNYGSLYAVVESLQKHGLI